MTEIIEMNGEAENGEVDKQSKSRITPPNMRLAQFTIVGTAPLMTAKFSKKMELMARMQEGKAATSKKVREARDFSADVVAAAYVSPEGWYGVHAAAFRNASISACRLVGFKMTLAKLSIFCEADGFDKEDGTPLVRIDAPAPEESVMPARNANNSVDLRARPLWRPGWTMYPRIRWDADQFTLKDIENLFARVGQQVGIGEGRPDSRMGAGLGYGLFDVVKVITLV